MKQITSSLVGFLPFIFLPIIVMSCNSSKMQIPKRPLNVPITAMWAGGVDGGHWFDCMPDSSDPFTYICSIYNENTGSTISKGKYLLRSLHWDTVNKKNIYLKVSEQLKDLKYNSYDGEKINLQNDIVLVPHGWIVYPFDDKHGKKREYKEGIPLSDEIEY